MTGVLKAFLFSICLWFAVLPVALAGQDEQLKLTFATVGAFPPYTWQEGDHKTGIDIDIIRTLADRTGYSISILQVPANRLLAMCRSGEIDGAFAAFRTAEREEYSTFLDTPLHFSTYKLFVKSGRGFAYEDIGDLDGKTVGRNRGFHVSDAFERAAAENKFTVVDVDSMVQAVRMLDVGRLDAIVGNEHEVAYLLKEFGKLDDIVALRRPVQEPRGAHLMISHKSEIAMDRTVLDQLSDVLRHMRSDGTMDDIYDRYVK